MTKPTSQPGTRADFMQVLKLHSVELLELYEMAFDTEVPAMCVHCCTVEPDGFCPHGNESILLYLEII